MFHQLTSSNILPTTRTTAFIRLRSDRIQIGFEWLDFDGDDCFYDDFHINVITETGARRFDFCKCVVHSLRKVCRFLRDASQTIVSGGFRNPDVYYDLCRNNDGYHLVVCFDGKGLREEFNIQSPQIEIDDEFMRTVYLD